jgi:hypothetical protein
MVGQFLAAFPRFSFDLATHIRATTHCDHLLRSLRRSALFFGGEKGVAVTPAEVLQFVRECSLTTEIANLEWECLPFSGRERLSNYVSSIRNSESLFAFTKESSGTTGRPFLALYSEFFNFLSSVAIVPWFGAAGAADVGRSQVAAVSIRNARPRKIIAAEPWEGGRLLAKVSLDERTPNSLNALFDLLDSLAPDVIISKPTIFEALLWGLNRRAIRPKHKPLLIVSSGQPLTKTLASALASELGGRVLDVYGTTELGLSAIRCSCCGALHFDESKCLVEIQSEGAQVVVSTILNDLMPIIKFRADDIRYLGSDCPNGLRSFEVTRLKPGQFLPLSATVGLDLGRLRVGKQLDTTVTSILASVQNSSIDIRVTVVESYIPSEEKTALLRQSIAHNVPKEFHVNCSIAVGTSQVTKVSVGGGR